MSFTYAGRYGPELALNAAGKLMKLATATVYNAGTVVLANLYTTRAKTAPAANPMTTDGRGNLTFFAAPGDYDIVIDGITVAVTVPVDPEDVQATVGGGSPTGPAGGVLAGTYPDPGFVEPMATQAELDAEATTRSTADAVEATARANADAAEAAARSAADAQLVPKALFDANTILVANADDTPLALAVAASRIIGRKAAGDIGALTSAEVKTLLALVAADISDFDTQVATTAILKSLVDAAGDLLVGTADNTVARLAKGNALDVLRVKGDGSGLEWAAPSGTIDAVTSTDVTTIVVLDTQAEYDALDPPDPDTLYFVLEEA